MKTKPDPKSIQTLLTKSVVDVIIRKELEAKLNSGKKLRIKLGIDPSGADLHIGHMVIINKLFEFQKLGHQIILLFGNFTGQIGDPTGKSESRSIKTQQEVEENAKTYLKQVEKHLDLNKVEIRWNADWLSKLNFQDIVKLASNFTVAQMLDRDMFQERIKKEQPISLHEFFYPLMQGYDSVALNADVELGGTEQTFNLLAGRILQKAYGQTPQNILTMPILVGTDGKKKMGKSENNYIGLNETPESMFGKIMSIPDSAIMQYFELCTNLTSNQLQDLKSDLQNGKNPRDIKLDLAQTITEIYHNSTLAQEARQNFINIFSNHKLPTNLATINFNSPTNILDFITQNKLLTSKSEARRLMEAGGIKLNQSKISDHNFKLTELHHHQVLQIGKKHFFKLNFSQ